MGYFYTNFTLATAETNVVTRTLKSLKRSAYITPPINGFTVIYDRVCDEQDVDEIDRLSNRFSKKLACAVFAVMIHDDDILGYWLYERGKLLDGYCSCPDYFDPEADPEADRGGDAKVLCRALGSTGAKSVQRVLDSSKYVLEHERHRDLVKLLNIPQCAITCGFSSIADGQPPAGLKMSHLIKTGR
ncbi:MAG: hypothetical protein KF678_02900 [Phycisphaeraceae bacterium]|nr:hypothetical protein [Phycisphaeraceae bacterium]